MDKMQIRLELNKYKMAEMTVHPESLKHNQYYEFPTEITQPMKRHAFQPKLRIVRIGAIRWNQLEQGKQGGEYFKARLKLILYYGLYQRKISCTILTVHKSVEIEVLIGSWSI